MSGGVDSSVATALLQAQGYAVQGVTMLLWREPVLDTQASPPDAIASARAVCMQLGIPHRVVDLRQPFRELVVDYFLHEYARGRTPNPCLRCNRLLKFGLLLDQARAAGAERLATGHYVRRVDAQGRHRLLAGIDPRKDQSYFLYALTQEQLARIIFPLGEWTKERVRAYARERQLPAAERPESQDVCFLQDGDYRRFVATYAPESVRPGPIVDVHGRVLGEHRGLPFYTVGQREGLGIAAARPLYVIALDPDRNVLLVGHVEALGRDALLAEQTSYIAGAPPPRGARVEAKIRYRARRVGARIYDGGGGQAQVTFDAPLRDIAPGQAVVFYDGDEVLGGGTIARPLSTAERSRLDEGV
jgi:tRNA-specific 2-thiouridylase